MVFLMAAAFFPGRGAPLPEAFLRFVTHCMQVR